MSKNECLSASNNEVQRHIEGGSDKYGLVVINSSDNVEEVMREIVEGPVPLVATEVTMNVEMFLSKPDMWRNLPLTEVP